MKIVHKVDKKYFNKIKEQVKFSELRVYDKEKHIELMQCTELELIHGDNSITVNIDEIVIINNPIKWCLQNSCVVREEILCEDIDSKILWMDGLESDTNRKYIEKIQKAIGKFTDEDKLLWFIW